VRSICCVGMRVHVQLERVQHLLDGAASERERLMEEVRLWGVAVREAGKS